MKAGECLHLINSFICSEGKYQNYPCPYQGDFTKCKSCVLVTNEMEEQMRICGCVRIPIQNEGENND